MVEAFDNHDDRHEYLDVSIIEGGDMADEEKDERDDDVGIELVEEPAETDQYVWVRIRLIR
jgi:hypothetical protein